MLWYVKKMRDYCSTVCKQKYNPCIHSNGVVYYTSYARDMTGVWGARQVVPSASRAVEIHYQLVAY
jgi:hypothetical protein